MNLSLRLRRLVALGAATGLLAGGAAIGTTGTASAAPAPVSVSTQVSADHGKGCTWVKGHWEKKDKDKRHSEKKWVKAHWECRHR